VSEIEFEELRSRLDDVTVLDVRTEAEYSGAAGYPCDPRQGHIPGARHVAVDDILESSADELRRLVGEPEGAELVTYCHGGGRSARAAAALYAAGYNARNYAGSWHEWSRRSEQ
jgi:thiosulfate/3-mercaptopyruvate sulfurtransferase